MREVIWVARPVLVAGGCHGTSAPRLTRSAERAESAEARMVVRRSGQAGVGVSWWGWRPRVLTSQVAAMARAAVAAATTMNTHSGEPCDTAGAGAGCWDPAPL